MKKMNVLISVTVFPILLAGGIALADSAASTESVELSDPTYDMSDTVDQNYDATNPNPNLYRTDYHTDTTMDRRNHRATTDCASIDLECMHNLKTGPGQNSY